MTGLPELRRRLAPLAAAAALFLAVQPARAQTTGATLEGRVVDEERKSLPGVTLTATATATGLQRVQTTGSDGGFRFPSIPVGTYNLKAELSGFQTVEQKGIVLNVATTRVVNVQLGVAGVERAIEVTGTAPVIQVEPTIGTVVSQHELENLPLNGRQFANLAALAPGTQLAFNSDPTKPDQLTIALNGGIGRNINFTVDGGDNTDDTIGGALQNYSIEGVQEFNVQTQQYKAEYGRSTGGVLSVITKTGTNEFHGSGFGFFRNKSFNSLTETEEAGSGEKGDYKRQQFGGSFGGPIVKDKVHFFGTYERTQRDTSYTVDTGGIFADQDGDSVPLPFRDNLLTGKVTANLTPTQFLQVRYGYQKNTGKYGANPLYTPDALGTLENKYHSFLVGHQWTTGGGSLNEFIFQFSRFNNSITADSTTAALYFPSGVNSGQNFNTPQTTNQDKYQFKDDYSFSKTLGGHRHDFKAGVNYLHEPTLGGDFSTGVDAPQFQFLANDLNSPIVHILQNGGNFVNSTPINQYSLYFQDDWRASDQLTFNGGVRYDYWDGFDLDQRTNPVWQLLSTQTRYNEDYLRDFQGGKGGQLDNDKNNFGPRIGFSYDLKGDSRTYLRGGYGIYYDFPYTNATILFPTGAVQSDYGVVYEAADASGIKNADGSLYRLGQPLPPNELTGPAVGVPREVASPSLATPFSRQGSFGVSHQINDWLGLNAEYTNIDYRDIPYRFRFNVVDPATGATRFPISDATRMWVGDGKADYNGVNFGVRGRLKNRLTFQGFYTLSKVEGNVLAGADEFRISDRGYQPGFPRDSSVDPLNTSCDVCIGPLNTDARHKLTLSGTYTFPREFNVSGMFRTRSATPFTSFAATDLDGNGQLSDLAAGQAHVNDSRGHGFSQLDLRVSKIFHFGGSMGVEGIFELFNVFNTDNPAGFRSNGTPSTFAGDPLQGEQRLMQFGARVFF